ncbi:MAG: PD40 domain-containing protein, partial [Myxococcales bacterium]|nr:PD40 domain-containing protein [Myxococcales bacterium]
MLCRTHLIGLIALSSLLACSRRPPPPPPPPAPAAPKAEIKQGEQHFANLAQITYGGENAEAYWSFDGTKLVFQSRPAGQSCDQIFSLTLGDEGSLRRISTGLGATTCSYFLPGDQEIIYASTHLGGAGCPPRPDHSQGYVWPLYASYDIFKTSAAGGPPVPLTNTPGYDAEATVCPVDGSILFTSVRDGDLELYRMDKDGQNVVRLTSTPGYDGGGFFNRDCTKIVWRASRPTGDALADYQRLLAQGLVRPTKLELYVANADGSDAQQVTYLDAASFAPYWFPNRNRIIFSSNYGDPQGREFELWAIDADGTDLERITFSPGFDGFPMFSPDGSRLAFSSNRATAEGAHDTNVFVVGWLDGILEGQAPADRVMRDVSWLADPQRGGRGTGTAGLAEARDWLGTRFAEIGLAPAGSQGFLQPFEVTTKVTSGPATSLTLGGEKVPLTPLSGSVSGEASGRLVFAGYGIVDEKSGIDDYRGVDAKNKIVVVRRFVPKTVTGEDARRLGDLYYKGFVARRQGAAGLIVVDAPEPSAKGDALPDEAPFPPLLADGLGDSGLPAAIISRAAGTPLIERLLRRSRVQGTLKIDLVPEKATASNVVGRLAATGPSDGGVIVVGAHYDHLGLGGPSSLAPGIQAPHLGADDT